MANVGKFLLCILGVIIIIGLIFKCVLIMMRRKKVQRPTNLMSMRSEGVENAADLVYSPEIEAVFRE